MARRADHTKQQLTDMAVQAGVKILKTKGQESLSARKIASEIGYTVGTLYNVFGSYEMLRYHINGVFLDEWLAAIEQMLKKRRAADPLMALAKFYMDYSQTHSNQWRMLFDDSAPVTQPVPDWYRDKIRYLFMLLENTVRPIVVDPAQAKRAAQILWTGVHGITALSLSGKLSLIGTESAEALVASFVKTFKKGMQNE